MVQKIHPRGVIWVPSSHLVQLSEKKDDLAVQYKVVRDLIHDIEVFDSK